MAMLNNQRVIPILILILYIDIMSSQSHPSSAGLAASRRRCGAAAPGAQTLRAGAGFSVQNGDVKMGKSRENMEVI